MTYFTHVLNILMIILWTRVLIWTKTKVSEFIQPFVSWCLCVSHCEIRSCSKVKKYCHYLTTKLIQNTQRFTKSIRATKHEVICNSNSLYTFILEKIRKKIFRLENELFKQLEINSEAKNVECLKAPTDINRLLYLHNQFPVNRSIKCKASLSIAARLQP